MQETLTRYLQGVPDSKERRHLELILRPIADRVSTHSITSAGLVIKAAANVLAKTGGSVWYGVANGKLQSKSAATDMPSLSGTVTNAKFNVFAFFCDAAGALTSQMGTEGATLADVVFPPVPEQKCCIGFIIINPTGTGNFVGGTTALDNATVIPNAAYVNLTGPFDPSVLL